VRERPAIRPNWYLLVAVVSWGLNFVAVKEVYNVMSPPALALIRFLFMWALLAAICLWRKESLRYPREDAAKLLYLGFVSMGVYMLFFLEGMWGSGATEGAILFQMSPVFTALLAPLFRQERFSVGTIVGAVIALSGTCLIVYNPNHGHGNRLSSNLVVVLAALLWAYSVIVMRPLLVKYSPLRVLTLSMLGGLPVMLAYGLMPTLHQNWGVVTPYAWLMFLHIALISGVVAFICFYQGVKQIGAIGATLYQFLVPVGAMLFAMGIQGTRPSMYQVAGLVVVLAGVAYASRSRYAAQLAAHAPFQIGDAVPPDV
jgi:drug/metabolite transporter (DMT)-like permease